MATFNFKYFPSLQSLLTVVRWCNKNHININIDKTKCCIYGTRANVAKFIPDKIAIETREINRCYQYLYLGVKLDECLTMKSNFNNILKEFSNKIYQFGKIRKFLDTETRILVYKQTVLPLTEYVSFVLSLNNKHDVEKLQKLQNRALRMCYNVQDPKDVRIRDLHERSRMDTLERRRNVQLSNIMFDQRGLFEKHHNRNTRNSDKYIFDINHINLGLYMKSP